VSKLSLVLLALVSFAACSNGSPTAPSADGIISAARGGVSPAPGVYALSFLSQVNGAWTEVQTLPTRTAYLMLRAYVTNSAGQPATAGSVTIQYCSYGGVKNDINRPDEAPMEACLAGTATWVRLASRSVTAGGCPDFGAGLLPGYVCTEFPTVQIPRTVGFRAVYQPKGSSIAAGTAGPANFTWVG